MRRVWMSNTDAGLDPLELPLPDIGTHADEGEGVEDDHEGELSLSDSEGDPYDDRPADDLPLDIEIDVSREPSALGDDDLGVASALDDDLEVEDRDGSLLDDRGHAEEGLEFVGDEELGIDPIPREDDDGGLEGLDDLRLQEVDPDFPPLDGDDDEEQELDVGIDLPEV